MAAAASDVAMNLDTASKGTIKIENTEKRDLLIGTEKDLQKRWQESHVFESDAPSISDFPPSTHTKTLHERFPKFFGTMAYPYVNGSPHLGHAFTVSKIEFAARVARAQGKRTLYPQGYHCTGMPIKACADKLVREIEMFGKDFSGCSEDDVVDGTANGAPTAPVSEQTKADVTKFSNTKKGKAALKTGMKTKYQFQVMLSLGVPLEEIHLFADAHHWLRHFPQLWQKHLTELGCAIDWRRSFVTTDANPYYDSFVRWQMRRLKELGKIQFGKRYTVYSPKDGQPCLDHDRQSGEGVLVQEYTALKCLVRQWSDKAGQQLASIIPPNARVYMVPATLRPETMYGQNLLFVSPKITYGVFKVSETEFFFITPRAARNMAFQSVFPKWGTFPQVAELKGSDVIGSLVHAPLSRQGDVYVVPMDTIKEGKGTGVVTSVPSDSPDDYAMTVDLVKKPEFYGIKSEWIVNPDPLPIISTPTYGDLTAPALVKKMKINSPKDAKALTEAKEIAYKEGFYNGTMIYGEFAGKPVQEAKSLVRQALLDSNDAIVYCEPDGLVISRSGDECVAAHLDQWFLTYGEADPTWRQEVLDHVEGKDGQNFNTFTTETKHAIEQTLGWMHQWALTRNYGLGTRLPWDNSQLVESLSDSTIYMSYYTIAHYLHSDLYGVEPGLGQIKPSQMTDDVWDYVYALRDEVESNIPKDTLAAMRREFTYWYPLDVRCSGKDLINNHLIFFLYIHQAVWKSKPQYLPRAIRMNGHATLNGEKMSKSTGNFLTLDAAVQKFGADATRIALADAGDGIEDANFEELVANASILKLFELRKWIEEQVFEAHILKGSQTYTEVRQSEKTKNPDVIKRNGEKVFWDKIFENELDILTAETIQHYQGTLYKFALKSGFYDLTAARDQYRTATSAAGIGMNHDCVLRYIELQAQMLAPIAPHWSSYIYHEVLKKVRAQILPRLTVSC